MPATKYMETGVQSGQNIQERDIWLMRLKYARNGLLVPVGHMRLLAKQN